MSKFSPEELEALLDDESLTEAALRDRLAGDNEALEEVAWLRSERELFSARAEQQKGSADALWQGIEARLPSAASSVVPTSWWSRFASPIRMRMAFGGLALAAAAAAVAMVVGGGREPARAPVAAVNASPVAAVNASPVVELRVSDKLLRANAAITEAELAFLSALDLLEAAYLDQKPSLSLTDVAQLDRDFLEARELFKQVQEPSSENPLVRRRLLSAYGSHVRSLQSTMMSFEEKSK